MNSQNQPSKHSLNYKLKPISLIVFSLFAQQAFAQSELVQDNASLALSKQLADSSVIESNPSVQNNNKKLVKIVVADASTAVKSKSNNQYKPNTTADAPLDVYDVLLGDDPGANVTSNNIPSTADRYGANKELLKTAAVTDAQAQGTGKTDSQGKPISNKPVDINLKAVTVRAKRFHEIGPLPGLGLTKEEIPGNVQSISAKEIKESHSLSLTDLMNKKLQSVNVNDYQGNPFQMDVTYRGFTAGPQIGTPQGLSVFLDGIRVNEPFGDVVNWDMIPMNAIQGVDVFPGSNPIFGLNTLGGAFTLKTKDGFTNEGVDAEVLTGSYGRKQLQVEGGINNGEFALFGAGNFFLEDGWRNNSPSKVNQFFGKASYRGEKLDLNLSTLLVKTDLVGNGLLPSEEYARSRTSVFTSPDTTKNTLVQFQLGGAFQVNDTFSITGQAYRRKSDRHAIGADVFTDYGDRAVLGRLPNAGQEFTCLFAESSVTKGMPLYYVVPVATDATGFADITTTNFYNEVVNNQFNGPPNTDGRIFVDFNNLTLGSDYLTNTALPEPMATLVRAEIKYFKNPTEINTYGRGIENPNDSVAYQNIPSLTDSSGNPILNGSGQPIRIFDVGGAGTFTTSGAENHGSNIFGPSIFTDDLYFYTPDPANPGGFIKNFVVLATATNNDKCAQALADNAAYRAAGLEVPVDGAFDTGHPAGVVAGVPTAIFNDNKINQIVDGASIQFNWNLEHHKFMVGASIDAANAEYSNASQLGFLTANRTAYLDPAQAHPMFIGAFVPLSNNNFEGTQTTKSLYFSETWTPVEAWHFNASGRYNHTNTKNTIASRRGEGNFSIGDLISYPDRFNVCQGDCTVNKPPTAYKPFLGFEVLDPAETEKFSFHSFNPQVGATWQAKENLNLFVNWAQGTRVPSVIELGCALDKTPGQLEYERTDEKGNIIKYHIPKSVEENRQCTLPTTLSGDPYLPQIKATTYDLGARGTFNSWLGAENIQWNLGAYQTNLKDDIYFVAVGNGAGFFDSIGNTRRRGFEAGLSGKKDKWGFGLNYGLTDATFQDDFLMISNDNSSAINVPGYGNVIQVKKGNRMPGVPLHNLNANVNYEITPKWQIGLSAVVHSESFVRGNENNAHKVGVIQDRGLGAAGNALVQPSNNPGTVPGYATFNLQSSYKFNKEWTATLQVTNLFDKSYFSAGRLGRNPFSPSINGAIGPDGYNHNSSEWLSTNFISPSAPRGVWFSLNWHFEPDKK